MWCWRYSPPKIHKKNQEGATFLAISRFLLATKERRFHRAQRIRYRCNKNMMGMAKKGHVRKNSELLPAAIRRSRKRPFHSIPLRNICVSIAISEIMSITLIMPMTSAPHQMRNRRRSRTASHPSICSSLRARRLKRGKRAANQYTGKSPSVKRVSKAIFTLEILSRGATTALDAGTRTTFLSFFFFLFFRSKRVSSKVSADAFVSEDPFMEDSKTTFSPQKGQYGLFHSSLMMTEQ